MIELGIEASASAEKEVSLHSTSGVVVLQPSTRYSTWLLLLPVAGREHTESKRPVILTTHSDTTNPTLLRNLAMSQDETKPDAYTDQTQQGAEILHDMAPDDYWRPDAKEIRRRFNIPEFDPEAFYPREGAALSGVYPDFLIHVESAADGPSTVTSPGASLTMVEAPKGSGKSTAADQFATYQMEHNDERIIRNGRQKSSDWRRMADWTTLWLPSGVDVDGRWMEAVDADDPDPEELCRAVRYYSDVFELVERLQAHPKGTYNVVFPDPYFRGCSNALATADATVKQPKFTPKNNPDPTPASHWWFGFLAARTFDGLRVDTTVSATG